MAHNTRILRGIRQKESHNAEARLLCAEEEQEGDDEIPASALRAPDVMRRTVQSARIREMVAALDRKLRATIWYVNVYDNGQTTKSCGAVAGNAVHAYRRDLRVTDFLGGVDWRQDNTLFITLTAQYQKTREGIESSWKSINAALPRWLRAMRAFGMREYIAVKEAHFDGGCHVHVLCRWARNIKVFKSKGKLRITSRALLTAIKSAWWGTCDVQGVKNRGAAGYVSKYLSKYSGIESALKRAKRGWKEPEDEDHICADVKRLTTVFMLTKMKQRAFTCSKQSRGNNKDAQASDLIKEMNSPTQDNRPELLASWRIPKSVCMHKDFDCTAKELTANDPEMVWLRETYGAELDKILEGLKK